MSVKNSVALQRCGGAFFNVTTTEDPVIAEIAKNGVGRVFATDTILAAIMTAPRSVCCLDMNVHLP